MQRKRGNRLNGINYAGINFRQSPFLTGLAPGVYTFIHTVPGFRFPGFGFRPRLSRGEFGWIINS